MNLSLLEKEEKVKFKLFIVIHHLFSFFDWKYPDKDFLKLEGIGVSQDEVVLGLFLDIDHKFEGHPDAS